MHHWGYDSDTLYLICAHKGIPRGYMLFCYENQITQHAQGPQSVCYRAQLNSTYCCFLTQQSPNISICTFVPVESQSGGEHCTLNFPFKGVYTSFSFSYSFNKPDLDGICYTLKCNAILVLAILPCTKLAWNKMQSMPILHSSQAKVNVQQ